MGSAAPAPKCFQLRPVVTQDMFGGGWDMKAKLWPLLFPCRAATWGNLVSFPSPFWKWMPFLVLGDPGDKQLILEDELLQRKIPVPVLHVLLVLCLPSLSCVWLCHLSGFERLFTTVVRFDDFPSGSSLSALVDWQYHRVALFPHEDRGSHEYTAVKTMIIFCACEAFWRSQDVGWYSPLVSWPS